MIILKMKISTRTSLHQTGDDDSDDNDDDQNNDDDDDDNDDDDDDNISNPPGLASIRLEIRSERGEALATIMQIIIPIVTTMMTIMQIIIPIMMKMMTSMQILMTMVMMTTSIKLATFEKLNFSNFKRG